MRLAALFLLLATCVPCTAQTPDCAHLQPKIDIAMRLLDQNRIAEAEPLFASPGNLPTDCPAVLLPLARLRAAQNNINESGKLFVQYLQAEPKDPEGPFYFGTVLLRIAYYPQAEAMADRALELNPSHVGALTLKGQLLAMRGQPAEAQQSLERAIAAEPKSAGPHFQLGALFDRRKQHEDAVKQFETVIALTPSDARAYDYLAMNLEQLGNAERAENAFRRGLAVNAGPLSDSFLDFNYGRFLLKRNRLRESQDHLNRAVEIAPRVRAVLYERGKLNLRLGHLSEAAQDARRALDAADPGHVILDLQVYYLLAECYARLGDAAGAAKYTLLAQEAKIPSRSVERK